MLNPHCMCQERQERAKIVRLKLKKGKEGTQVTGSARTTGFLSLRRAGFSCSFLWTAATSPARTRPWMFSDLGGVARPFWLPGPGICCRLRSTALTYGPSACVCERARSSSCVWCEEEPPRKNGRGRTDGDQSIRCSCPRDWNDNCPGPRPVASQGGK